MTLTKPNIMILAVLLAPLVAASPGRRLGACRRWQYYRASAIAYHSGDTSYGAASSSHTAAYGGTMTKSASGLRHLQPQRLDLLLRIRAHDLHRARRPDRPVDQ